MKTASDVYNEAAAASVKALGTISVHHMLGALTAQVAELLNELAQYQIPDTETGNHQTAFVHQGLHLVAEWERESGDVMYLWDGSSDILPLFGDVPDWVDAAIAQDNEEWNSSLKEKQ
jgi:hypothetical protein